MLTDPRNVRFGDSKIGVDRVQSLHGDERRTARADEMAHIHIADACPPSDRRADSAVIEIHLRDRDRGIGFHGVRPGYVIILTGDYRFRAQLRLPLKGGMRENRIGLRRSERRIEWTRIDSEQRITLLDIGTVFEIA